MHELNHTAETVSWSGCQTLIMVNWFFAVLVTHVSIQRELHPSVGHTRRWPDYLNWQAKLAIGLWGAMRTTAWGHFGSAFDAACSCMKALVYVQFAHLAQAVLAAACRNMGDGTCRHIVIWKT